MGSFRGVFILFEPAKRQAFGALAYGLKEEKNRPNLKASSCSLP